MVPGTPPALRMTDDPLSEVDPLFRTLSSSSGMVVLDTEEVEGEEGESGAAYLRARTTGRRSGGEEANEERERRIAVGDTDAEKEGLTATTSPTYPPRDRHPGAKEREGETLFPSTSLDLIAPLAPSGADLVFELDENEADNSREGVHTWEFEGGDDL